MWQRLSATREDLTLRLLSERGWFRLSGEGVHSDRFGPSAVALLAD